MDTNGMDKMDFCKRRLYKDRKRRKFLLDTHLKATHSNTKDLLCKICELCFLFIIQIEL